MRIKIQIAVIVALVAFTACSSTPETATKIVAVNNSQPKASIEAKQVAAEQEASKVTEIKFDEGQAALTEAARVNLDKLMGQAVPSDRVEEVIVLSWADQEYPSVNTKKLSKAQQQLAKDRSKNIADYLKKLNQKASVKTHNMAARPNALSNLIKTKDARLKKSLEVAGIPSSDNTNGKAPSKAGHAMVMVIMKEE